MSNYVLNFNLTALDELDKFALLACQSYNLGNSTYWFGLFRGGIYAVYNRTSGIIRHYYQVHAWIPQARILADAEYHLSSIFFNMDSALECLTFGINALGNAVDPTLFRNVTDAKALQAVNPADIFGRSRVAPLSGYTKYFPQLQTLWKNRLPLIEEIRDQHDVSKHRQVIFIGGQSRSDPPVGFYEALGIQDDPRATFPFQPMAEIILKPDPKAPRGTRTPRSSSGQRLLEELATEFVELLNESAKLACADAKNNISLPHAQFIK